MLGRLGFIGVAQGAGFKLREIRELLAGIDDAGGMAERMRSLSERKLSEVEKLRERTKAVKGWLEVAKECGCATPEECALFPDPDEPVADFKLTVTRVAGKSCRRPVPDAAGAAHMTRSNSAR